MIRFDRTTCTAQYRYYSFFILTGFLPETSIQIAIADSIVDQIQDCILRVIKMWFTKDPDEKVLSHALRHFCSERCSINVSTLHVCDVTLLPCMCYV